MLYDLLRDLGCAEAIVVREADSALGQLEIRTPRILLVAARMPGEDGFAFTHRMRRAPNLHSNAVSTVLTFSGVAQSDITNALNAGADAILTFPMSRNQLSNMLHLLDTQKRAFVRAATYVGPCRRRGLVGGDGGRRLEDFGAPEALNDMIGALKGLFEAAQRGAVNEERLSDTAGFLAAWLRAARPDRQIDDAALAAQCNALVRQFAEHAPNMKSFDHAFAPLRKLLVGVAGKDAKRPGTEAAAA